MTDNTNNDLVPNAPQGEFVLFQSGDGQTNVECRFEADTLWLSLNQVANLFNRDKSVISKHLKNIYDDGELVQNATVAKYATVQIDASLENNRTIEHCNL